MHPLVLADDVVPGAIATGRYYPSRHPDHGRDELTRAVRASKTVRTHDAQFATRLHAAVRHAWPTTGIDAVVTLPPKPTTDDRLAGLRELVADTLRAADAGAVLRQAFDVPGYRAMTIAQRRATPRGRFLATGDVSGLRLLLVDDVVTSGVQATQAIAALLGAGAAEVRFVAVAQAVDAPEDPHEQTQRTRPYKTCLCAPDKPCAACPLAHPCGCGARAGQRCQRPSGHRGDFVMTHEDRLLRSDVDAIARDPAEVEARLRAQRNNPDDMRAWARALRGLAHRPALWHGRIDAAVIEQLAALTTVRRDEPRDDDHEQLRLELP